MRQLGFDYIAFGFGRNQATLFDENGRLIGAQPGSLAGNVLTEAGATSGSIWTTKIINRRKNRMFN